MESRKDIMSQQSDEDKSLTEDLSNLSKKAKFFQKQVDDAQGQLKDIASPPTLPLLYSAFTQ